MHHKDWRQMFHKQNDTGTGKMFGIAMIAAAASAAATYYLFGTKGGERQLRKAKRVAGTLKDHAGVIKEDIKESWADAKDSFVNDDK